MKRNAAQSASLIVVVLIMTLLSCGGGGGGGTPSNSSSRQWTYMVYMGANNNLSDAGLLNLNDMEKVGSSGAMAIVVQAEFSPHYSSASGITQAVAGRIYVQNDGDPSKPNLNAGTSIGYVDMANPTALTDFITWAKTNYPAEHYALVVWDHGGGWKAQKRTSFLKGAVQDETSGNFMSLPDLAKGVANSGVHFDVINFDACLMAMYEVAYEFKGLTDYMVFSEETEPGTGDPYDTILGALAANPSMTGRTLATTIVDKYNVFYTPDTREGTTKSAISMAAIDALDAKVVTLAKSLKNNSSASAAIAHAQANTQNYAYTANHDLYDFCSDLSSVVTGTAKTACTDIMSLITSSVVVASKTTGTNVANSHGLAIYVPMASETTATDLTDYAKLKCNLTTRASASGTWGDFVEVLLGTSTLQQTGTGNFALYVYWTKLDGTACGADLDLYVAEPDGSSGNKWYAPWMGQTTPNGFFSQESSQAGKSEEYYIANDLVMKGDYFFLVNYYASSPTCTQAAAHILIQDPVTVNGTWTELTGSPVLLDLLNPAPSTVTDLNVLNTYSDWWYPGSKPVRLMTGGAFQTGLDLPINNRNSMLIFRHSRGSVLNGINP